MSLFRFMQCFNSIMVRLKDFNSTMVRLKDRTNLFVTSPAVFQFHYGTIKRANTRRNDDPYASFNSTMVRLKEPSCYIPYRSMFVSIPLWYD